jgi:hypothetical protein
MSRFQMFASPLLGWYWIVAPPHATQSVFGGLSAPLSDWVRLRLFDDATRRSAKPLAILAITQNLNRTLLRVRWEAGGDCVVFSDYVDENSCPLSGSRGRDGSSQGTELKILGGTLHPKKPGN